MWKRTRKKRRKRFFELFKQLDKERSLMNNYDYKAIALIDSALVSFESMLAHTMEIHILLSARDYLVYGRERAFSHNTVALWYIQQTINESQEI